MCLSFLFKRLDVYKFRSSTHSLKIESARSTAAIFSRSFNQRLTPEG